MTEMTGERSKLLMSGVVGPLPSGGEFEADETGWGATWPIGVIREGLHWNCSELKVFSMTIKVVNIKCA